MCGVDGLMTGTMECWLVNGKTNIEKPDSRNKTRCNKTCNIPCPTKECGPCGDYGKCSESCGLEGTQKGTRECWLNNGTTRNEIPRSREEVPCNDTCYVKCPPIPVCGPCGEYGPCGESCGKDGTKESTKDCWKEDADTRDEIIGSRHQVQCIDTCYVKCPPLPVCGPCGEYGPCSESCGKEGTKESTKDCWEEDADTRDEIDSSRHQVQCSDTCYVKCPPIPVCGPCGEYGLCSESCGKDGTKESIKDCWEEDADTRAEIIGSRHQVQCIDTCYVKCPPITVCGPCGEYGPCSESCGKEGTKEGTKDCWEEDADTRDEIIGSRHQVQCSDACYVKCPPIPVCGPCGDYGPCSESCGKEGTKEGTKDCWEEDADTKDEIVGSRHVVMCIDVCSIECPCKVYNSYICLIVVEMSCFISLIYKRWYIVNGYWKYYASWSYLYEG